MKLLVTIIILGSLFIKTDQAEPLEILALRTPGLNSGTVYSKDEYVWVNQNCLYLESENVTAPYKTWSSSGHINYRYQSCGINCTAPPPIGIRSGVPLGGISTGSVELRADGTLHEWTIINQSPSSAAKIQIFDEAFFGIRVEKKKSSALKFIPYKNFQTKKFLDVLWKDFSRRGEREEVASQAFVLQTHPVAGLPGVKSLKYQGLYPSAQLTVNDDRLLLDNVSITAMSTYFVDKMNESATPAVSFIFAATNPSSSETMETSFMFNLPFGLEKNMDRGFTFKSSFSEYFKYEEKRSYSVSHMDCFNICNQWAPCLSWTFDEEQLSCLMSSTVNLNGYSTSKTSGLKGTWSVLEESGLKCITLNRLGKSPPSGNISLCTNTDLPSVTFGIGNNVFDMWNEFSKNGAFSFTGKNEYGIHGSISAKISIPPGKTVQFPMTMAWYYPNRDFGEVVYGNWYKHLYSSSENVANAVLNGKMTNIQKQVAEINKLHEAFFNKNSSVPVWLSDILVNSIGHIRSAMWFADGRWRQWEAYDCTNIDSVHNDGERHIPYMMFQPGTIKNKMVAWAKSQQADGMIPEQLQTNCFIAHFGNIIDVPSGRVMSDVSSMFIVYLLELYKWGNDSDILMELWPYAKKAAEWHMTVSQRHGVPYRIQNTYDVLGLNAYDVCAYNSAFHLLAMRAIEEMAKIMGDDDFAEDARTAFAVGQVAMEEYLWNNTMGYYNSYNTDITNATLKNVGALMTDSFYAQVLAHSVGLGDLVDVEKLISHLDSELRINDSPYGLLVQTGRYPPPGPAQDNAVWMMGNGNWASTQIRLGADVNMALQVAKKSLDRYRTVLNDLWNVAGVTGGTGYGADGQPYITSHYGYYMSSWHILLALSGQQADLPKGYLVFDPKIEPPFNYPVMLPGILGTISGELTHDGAVLTYRLSLIIGTLELKDLGVSNSFYPGQVYLTAGNHVQWNVDV